MSTFRDSRWRNCALRADAEMMEIDRLVEHITLLSPNIIKIRELITSLELCHHKAEHWIYNIIEAIGVGDSKKGLGNRSPGQLHPREKIWQNASAALAAWCAGCSDSKIDFPIENLPASRFLVLLGERSPLKEWQVQRVIEKIRSLIHWPQSLDDPTAQYNWILLTGGAYESAYRKECPVYFKEHEDYWQKTVRTMIHDTQNEQEAELSLGLAIDMLWPCHWRFITNLQIVLAAIGGNIKPEEPFAACGRNLSLLPNRHKMATIVKTLGVYCGELQPDNEVDDNILTLLGDLTAEKHWLAASLSKTISLQLNPPAEMQQLSALEGPNWIQDIGPQ